MPHKIARRRHRGVSLNFSSLVAQDTSHVRGIFADADAVRAGFFSDALDHGTNYDVTGNNCLRTCYYYAHHVKRLGAR